MAIVTGAFLFVATVLAMEGFAYAAHRWIMHGRVGWWLHESHHRERTGRFELNDLYAAIFALPSIALIWLGTLGSWGSWATWAGAGIAAYGAIYFGFHDVIVHRRVTHRIVPRSRYFKRIVQAHRIHHAVETREGAVSFGFIYAPPVERLKTDLTKRNRAGVRTPRGGSTVRGG